MNLDLDTQWLRTSMTLWRDVVEHKIPLHDNLKVHLMSRQADSLKNFIQIGQSWKTVLGSCKPTGPQDEIEFEALMAEVNELVGWAKAKLAAIEELGVQEMFTDAAQDLLSDPELGPAIRGILKSIRKQNPDDGKGQLEADMFALRNQFELDDKVRSKRERLAILSPQDRRRLEDRIGVVQGNLDGTRKPIVYFPADLDQPDLRLFGVDLRQLELIDEEPLPPREVELSNDTEDSPSVSQTEADDLFA